MRKILCIIDGMTDPGFQVWDYPNLASMNLLRWVDTCRGQEPESLGCTLRLLGVRKVPQNLRGFAEALGNQIPVGSHDLVLRGSWFALDDRGRCAAPADAPPCLPESREYRYYPLGQNKSLLILPGMAPFVSDIATRPPYRYAGKAAQSYCPQGCEALQRIFQANLGKDRCLIPWGQSVGAALPPLGQKSAAVCAAPIVKGIARLLGMDLIDVPGATGDVDTDLLAKAKAAAAASKEYPFVLLHINGADEAAHRRRPEEKAEFLRMVDDVVIPMLLRSGCELQVTSDHGTDPATGCHLGDIQPLFSNQKGAGTKKKMTFQILPAEKTDERRQWAIARLTQKAQQLGRVPHKADFGDVETIRIKAALGPWPRALEAAGLKEKKGEKDELVSFHH